MKFTPTARSLGIFSAAATVILVVAYAVTLSRLYSRTSSWKGVEC